MNDVLMISLTNRTMTSTMAITSQQEISKKGKIRKKATLPASGIDKRTLIIHLNYKVVQYAWCKTCKR